MSETDFDEKYGDDGVVVVKGSKSNKSLLEKLKDFF